MKITDRIIITSENCTISEISVDGQFYGYNLADPLRPSKIKKITGLPLGIHEIGLSYSPKYSGKFTLDEVPECAKKDGVILVPEIICEGWQGVRWHAFNTCEQTDGCYTTGSGYRKATIADKTVGLYVVSNTAHLVHQFNLMIMYAIQRGETVTIEKTL